MLTRLARSVGSSLGLLFLFAALPARAATYNVVNTADSGAGSLRQAILDANANPGADQIAFDIPATGVQTIAPLSALPNITQPVTIDGYTQPGASPNTLAVGTDAVLLVALDGGGHFNGLTLASGSGGSTIRGLVINRFSLGIVLSSTGNVVTGNYLGVDAGGTLDRGNSFGVSIQAADNSIGGSMPGQRNVISGNDSFGVSTNSPRTIVQGNYIGTNAAGTAALGNAGGVSISGSNCLVGGSNGTPGGSCSGACNLISGSAGAGLTIDSFFANQDTDVRGNYIGTDVTGQTAIPNGDGIRLGNSISNRIGSATGSAADRNVISGNAHRGIYFTRTRTFPTTRLNTVARNYVGLSSSGGPLGNVRNGIELTDAFQSTIAENAVGYNGGNGISIYQALVSQTPEDDSWHDRNRVTRNAMFANGAAWAASRMAPPLAIDLSGPTPGVTANDAADSDHGANRLQNFPVLTAVTSTGDGNMEVKGTLNSIAATDFVIELFRSHACDASGFGPGEQFLGDTMVTTNGSGDATFDVILPAVKPGNVITATATDADGDTSELSACSAVVAAPATGGRR